MTAGAGAHPAPRRLAGRRAAEARRRRDRRILVTSVAAVMAVLAGLVAASALTGPDADPGGEGAPRPASAAVMADLTGVPATTLDTVGLGTASTGSVRPVDDPPLTADGKPLVLYIGAEYCPFCAAQRWPLVQALSRFGTFEGLRTTRSAANDVHPLTPTFTFAGATYTSRYLSFDARELYGNEIEDGRFVPLQTLTAEQSAVFDRYGGGFPFLDIGGRFVAPGASFDPGVLHEQSWASVAASLDDPADPVARGVDGAANLLTAALCEATGGRPSRVCTAPGVAWAAAGLHG